MKDLDALSKMHWFTDEEYGLVTHVIHRISEGHHVVVLFGAEATDYEHLAATIVAVKDLERQEHKTGCNDEACYWFSAGLHVHQAGGVIEMRFP